MKRNLLGTLIFMAVISAGCRATPTALTPTQLMPATAQTATPTLLIPSPTPTENPGTAREKLQAQAEKLVEAYNQLVKLEQKSGEGKITHTEDTGEERYLFTGKSYEKIIQAFQNLSTQKAAIFEQYLRLYRQDHQPTPYPAQGTKEQTLQYYRQLLGENQARMEMLLKSENVDKIYNPDFGSYEATIRFEDAAWFQLAGEALDALRLNTELSPELLKKHLTILKNLEPETPAAEIQRSITSLPFYRNDLTFFQYVTGTRVYVLDASGDVIEISPIEPPQTSDLTPLAPLSKAELEKKARSLIQLWAPGTDLEALTEAGGEKINTFFFRWENREKALLDDGRSYPFIQVGFNEDGELLNYYNTLPLAR